MAIFCRLTLINEHQQELVLLLDRMRRGKGSVRILKHIPINCSMGTILGDHIIFFYFTQKTAIRLIFCTFHRFVTVRSV